jgi:hypothetical protein
LIGLIGEEDFMFPSEVLDFNINHKVPGLKQTGPYIHFKLTGSFDNDADPAWMAWADYSALRQLHVEMQHLMNLMDDSDSPSSSTSLQSPLQHHGVQHSANPRIPSQSQSKSNPKRMITLTIHSFFDSAALSSGEESDEGCSQPTSVATDEALHTSTTTSSHSASKGKERTSSSSAPSNSPEPSTTRAPSTTPPHKEVQPDDEEQGFNKSSAIRQYFDKGVKMGVVHRKVHHKVKELEIREHKCLIEGCGRRRRQEAPSTGALSDHLKKYHMEIYTEICQ